MKKRFFSLLSLVISATLLTASFTFFSKKPDVLISVDYKRECIAFLNEQEDAAWKRLAQNGIDKQEVSQQVETLRIWNTPREVHTDISASTKTLVDEVLTASNLNPQKISIDSIKNTKGISAACAGNGIIGIIVERFDQLSRPVKKFIIAHEAQHIVHGDTITMSIIAEKKDSPNLTEAQRNELDQALMQLSRFFEFRADINAALLGNDYAKGYVLRAHTWLEKSANPGTTHPKHEERLAWAQKIAGSTNTNKHTAVGRA